MRSSVIAVVAASLVVLVARAEGAPSADASMHMKLEKTWLGVDVARVNVRFDPATASRMRELASGHEYSASVAEPIARVALDADAVDVDVEFLRDVSLGDFLEAAHDNLRHARDAGYISDAQFATAWQAVQTKFAPLAKHGFHDGDRLMYRAREGSLQTIVKSGDRVLLDTTTRDPGGRRAMIASYFAPKSDFRKGLIKSLF
jgi:hypothetical protein